MKKISLACLVLSGCAGTAPEPPVEWERERPTAPQQTPDRLAVPDVASLSLERAWAVAESLHPELAAARSRVEAAEGRALQAGLLPNPTLLGRLESAPFEGKTLENAEILAGISQRLPVGGRLGAARDVEERERERLILDYHVQRAGLRSRIHAAFAAALYSEAVVRLLREGRELADRGVAVAQARRAAGDALLEEVARVELERVRADVELDQAESLREAAILALTATLGDPRLNIGALEGGLEAAFDVPSIETVLAGLDRSPFAALAEADVAVARAKIDQAKVERIPDVTLDLLYRRLEASETNAFDVGVSVALPLFDRNQGRIREGEAEWRGAQARGRALRNEAARSAREAHLQLATSLRRAALLRTEVLPRTETVQAGAEARYRGGDLSLADLLPIRRERISTRLAYLESLRDVMGAWARLKPFLGDN